MRRTAVAALAACAVVLGASSRAALDAGTSPSPTASAADESGVPSASPVASPKTSSVASTASTPQRRLLTVVSSGDILLHERTWNQARRDARGSGMDFAPQFADVAPIIQGADLALCHLETPVAPAGGPYEGYPTFSVPPQIIPAIVDTGFDMCGTASNHSFDQGSAGIRRTLDALDNAGLPHTGSARSKAEAAAPLVMNVATDSGTVRVGIVAFTYGFNGIGYPQGHTWAANIIDARAITAAAQACRDAGAEIVIAKLHWGTEYTSTPSKAQRTLARTLADSGLIDLIDGAHSHSVQPIERIGRMWVIYSHGNLVAAHREPATIKSEGVISRWTFTEQPSGGFAITAVEVAPTLITDSLPVRVLDTARDLRTGDWVATTKTRLRQAQRRTMSTINALGATAALID